MRSCIKSAMPHYSFLFNHPPPTELYTLSLHDLFRSKPAHRFGAFVGGEAQVWDAVGRVEATAARAAGQLDCQDRKCTRLNSSHEWISYAVFGLKKKSCGCDRVDAGVFRACTSELTGV